MDAISGSMYIWGIMVVLVILTVESAEADSHDFNPERLSQRLNQIKDNVTGVAEMQVMLL